MKFRIDENLPIEVAELLRAAGYDALTVLEQNLGGQTDLAISQICQQEDRILITPDLDFSDIRAYPPQNYPGMIVLRLMRQDKNFVLSCFQRVFRLLGEQPINNQLWIVDSERVRIRE